MFIYFAVLKDVDIHVDRAYPRIIIGGKDFQYGDDTVGQRIKNLFSIVAKAGN